MATWVRSEGRRLVAHPKDAPEVRTYSIVFSAVFLCAFTVFTWGTWGAVDWRTLVAFTVVAAAADAFRIQLGREMTFAVSLPVCLASGMVLEPAAAAVVGFMATVDPREWRRQVPLSRALFNRCQVAACVLLASAAFHQMGGYPIEWPAVVVPSMVALGVDALANVAFVAWPVSRMHGIAPAAVVARMFEPGRVASVLRYAFTGLMAPLMATAWLTAGIYGLAACLLPIALAWFSFREAEQLTVAAQKVEHQNAALADALDGLAAERRDERLAIAGELHDDVLPCLFQVHLMGQVLGKDLERGQLLELEEDMPQLLEAANRAQAAIRAVIGSLRKSVLGPTGLTNTIGLHSRGLEASSRIRFQLEVDEIRASEATQLLVYQVAREAMTNAAKHSAAGSAVVRVWQEQGVVRLAVSDQGTGFDMSGAGPMDHFGLAMMRERVEAVGGRLVIDSVLGHGTTVGLSIPPDT